MDTKAEMEQGQGTLYRKSQENNMEIQRTRG